MEIEARIKGRANIPPESVLTFDRADLRHEDFSGRKLEVFDATASQFDECRFERMRIDNACFGGGREPSVYVGCSFDRSRIRISTGGVCRFERCSFREVDLRDWFAFQVEMIDCVFTGRLRHSVFNGTVDEVWRDRIGRERNEFRGNDFSGTEFDDVSFRTGIDLTAQRLPEDERFVVLPNVRVLERAQAVVRESGNASLIAEAESIFEIAADQARKGQQQLLLDKRIYAKKRPADIVDALWDILRSVVATEA